MKARNSFPYTSLPAILRTGLFLATVAAPVALPVAALKAQSGAPASSGASTAPPPAAQQRANALFAAGDWNATLLAHQQLATEYPGFALFRFRVGVALVELGRADEGEQALRAGETLGVAAGPAAFRIAQALAEQKRIDEAIGELLRSAASGFGVAQTALTSDQHFRSLTTHTRWPEVLDAFDALARPCMHDPRFREFDFWLGDWDVRPTGSPATGAPARNHVTLEDNGCVVMEHWSAPGGSEGQSFNLFDRSVGLWRQTWVDNQGGQHDYRGRLTNGNMVFEGDTPAPGGQLGRVPTRLTFFHISADSVRQFSEQSTDGGKTWVTAYDLMYVRYAGPPRP